jgi:hypothetical protein
MDKYDFDLRIAFRRLRFTDTTRDPLASGAAQLASLRDKTRQFGVQLRKRGIMRA